MFTIYCATCSDAGILDFEDHAHERPLFNGKPCSGYRLTGKKYIGCTGMGLEERKKKHKEAAEDNHPLDKSAFHRAIRKYGFDNFLWKTIGTDINEERAIEKEIAAIREQKTLTRDKTHYPPGGYNIVSPDSRIPLAGRPDAWLIGP